MYGRALTVVAAALLMAAGALPQVKSYDVSGVIVNLSGKPSPKAEIARYFLLSDGKYTPYEPITADASGKFSGKIQPYQLPMTYIVLDAERNLGACVDFTEESVKKPMRIVLTPLAEVRYGVEIENGFKPSGMNMSIACPDTGTLVLLTYDRGAIRIPAGKYSLNFFSMELKMHQKPFAVRSGETVDLGTQRLELTPISKNIGKPALPIDFAEARGVNPEFKLSDLKGKWVLIEFWGYW